jgi:hypothetical protein
LPATYAEPNAFVADAAPGSNGTAHYLVATRFSWYYIWADTSTGQTLDAVNLTDLGLAPADFLQTFTDPSWRMSLIDVQAGTVVIARGSSGAIVDVILFAEGDSAAAVSHKLLLPPPAQDAAASLAGLAIARNGSDAGRPVVVWVRNLQPVNSTLPAVDVGTIQLDVGQRAAGQPAIGAYMANHWAYYLQYYSSPSAMYDYFRLWAYSQPVAAAVGSTSGLWVTLVAVKYTCTMYSGPYCVGYNQSLVWTALSAAGATFAIHEVAMVSTYDTVVRAAALPAPDGSVACALSLSSGKGAGTLAWARLATSPTNISRSPLAPSIATSLDLFDSGAGPEVALVALGNGTAWPQASVQRASGWPGALSPVAFGSIGQPLERMRVASATASQLRLVGGTQNEAARAGEAVGTGALASTSYAQAWPAIATASASGTTALGVSGWQGRVAAPVRSIALATLDDGSRVGAVVSLENGTGMVRLLTASGSPLSFRLHEPLRDLHAEATTVRAVSLGDRALIVVETMRPFLWQYVGGYYYQGYLWFTANASGAQPARPVTSDFNSSYYYAYATSWTLTASQGRGFLQTGYGLFIIDPALATSTWRIAFDPSSPSGANISKLIGNNESIVPQSPLYEFGGCGSYYYIYCFHSVVWWASGNHLYGAFAVSNYSLSQSAYYCHCTLRLRVVHWSPNDAVAWSDAPLALGTGNDTLYFRPYADVGLVSVGDSTSIIVSARQPAVWDRAFRVNYSVSAGALGAPALLRQVPAVSTTMLQDHLGTTSSFAAVLRTSESGAGFSSPYPIPLREAFAANATDARTLRFNNVTLYCQWYYWYYWFEWPYPGPYGCPRWIPTSWGGDMAFLVVEYGRARFFSVNHAPTAPHLLAPAHGAVLSQRTVAFTVAPASDADGDALVYRYQLFDRHGNLVREVERDGPALTLDVADGGYSWTCSVTDGVARVGCVGNFSFTLDATAPLAHAGGPYAVHPGEGVLLNGSGSADPSGIVSHSWRVGGGASGDLEILLDGETATLSWPQLRGRFAGGPTVPVHLTVVDGQGNSATAATFIVLLPDPMVLELVSLTQPALEGQELSVAANVTWGLLRFAWDDPEVDTLGLTVVWDLPFAQGAQGLRASFFARDSGTFTVTATAVGAEGGYGTSQLPITIANLPPVATLDGVRAMVEGDEAAFRVTASDASPTDLQSLAIAWSYSGGVAVEGAGFQVTVRALSSGPAAVWATVTDPDGATVRVEIAVEVAQAADPATDLWVASVGATWAQLRWTPTLEVDFAHYRLTVSGAAGAPLRTVALEGLARTADRYLVEGLDPETWYRFDLVVVATGGALSAPAVANATTAPPGAPQEPPPAQPGPGPSPPPAGPGPGGSTVVVTEAAASPLVWAVIALLAGAAAFLYMTQLRNSRRD